MAAGQRRAAQPRERSMHTRHKAFRALAAWLLFAHCAQAETLVLSAHFVDEFKNKATISVKLEVDVHPQTPHSISSGGNDGDIHMSGLADRGGRRLVAEFVKGRKGESS